MSIQDLIASAQNNATTATAAAAVQTQPVIEEAQTTQAVEATPAADATVAAANPLAGLSAEQIAAVRAALGQQQPAAQTTPAQAAPAPQTTALAAAVQPQQQVMPAQSNVPAMLDDPALAAFMVTAPTLDNITAGLAVDTWIKPKYGSMLVNEKPVAEFTVILDPTERSGLTASTTVRYSVGDTAQYLKTYDGKRTHDGIEWLDAVRQAMAVSDKPLDRPYASFDMVMQAAEDVMSIDGKEVIVQAGTMIGHATAVTGTANAKKLLDAIRRSGFARTETDPATGLPMTVGEPVLVKVTNVSKSKGSNRQWGILDFELLGLADQ